MGDSSAKAELELLEIKRQEVALCPATACKGWTTRTNNNPNSSIGKPDCRDFIHYSYADSGKVP
jgi:hypothetical protein